MGLKENYNEDDVPEEDDGEENFRKNQMWAVSGNTFSACETAVNKLPPAQYVIRTSNSRGLYFQKTEVNLDSLIEFPDNPAADIIKNIEIFWQKEQHFRDRGFLWKRGILLWGPAGSGKTSTVQMLAKKVINQGGLTIYVTNPSLAATGLRILRGVEPKRPLIVVLEDLDAIIEDHGESDLLALIDGELQIDNVVFLATTNYPERLDRRIINRPSRFDIIKWIDMPSDSDRRRYLMDRDEILAADAEELEKWVVATERLSLAHVKEILISVRIFEQPFDISVTRLREMNDLEPPSSGDYDETTTGKAIGFGSESRRPGWKKAAKKSRGKL